MFKCFKIKFFICIIVLLLIFCQICLRTASAQSTTTSRPYQFGFTIEEQQHRFEKKDERGIVMGEFGFITADGIYHVTVYATDEQGRFRILAMKNYPYKAQPSTTVKPKEVPIVTTTTVKPKVVRSGQACSGCALRSVETNEVLPNNVNTIKPTKVNKGGKNDIRPLSKSLPSIPITTTQSVGSKASQPGIYIKTESNLQTLRHQHTQPIATATTSTLPHIEGVIPDTTNTVPKIFENVFMKIEKPTTNIQNAPKSTNTLTENSSLFGNTQNKDTNYKTLAVFKAPKDNILSKDTNPIERQKPIAGNSITGNTAIMDIIMNKILPTLVANNNNIPQPNAGAAAVPSLGKPPVIQKSAPGTSTGSNSIYTPSSSSTNGGNSASGDDGDLYRFKYILDYNGHSETGKRNGNKQGNFYSIGDDGIERTVEYVANENGFQPHISWRKLDKTNVKDSAENSLKEYEFVWFKRD